MRKRVFLYPLAALCLVFTFAGCYSFSQGSVPPHLKTVYIPQADDASGFGRATIRQELTQAIIQKFQSDNSLHVVDGAGADSRLDVTITSIRSERQNVSSQAELETVRQMVVEARATFTDNVKHRPIFTERTFSGRASYQINQGVSGQATAITQSIDKLTTDLLQGAVSNW